MEYNIILKEYSEVPVYVLYSCILQIISNYWIVTSIPEIITLRICPGTALILNIFCVLSFYEIIETTSARVANP